MSIDGIFLSKLKDELECTLQNTRIEKIHQPSKEELVVLLRSFHNNYRLLIQIRPSAPRVCLVDVGYENPTEPPMFCMLLRKHLSGAKFSHIEQIGYERVLAFCFNAINEMGDAVSIKLVVELMGKQTNIILVGNDDRIIDCVRKSDIESSSRLVQPGAKYVYPDRVEKQDLLTADSQKLVDIICADSSAIAKSLVAVLDGVSPLVSREILTLSKIDTDQLANELTQAEKDRLINVIDKFKADFNGYKPVAVYDNNGVPFEFSYMPITQYGESYKTVEYKNCSSLLDTVFSKRDKQERIRSFASDLVKLLNNLHNRVQKKINIRQKELKMCENGEKFRIFGELLKANLYSVEKGAPYIDVQNFYDEQLKMVRIPLDTALSPTQNAQKYFKEYKKCCNASALLGDLIAQSQAELQYIESVMDELSRAGSVADLREIKQELVLSGYLRQTAYERKQKNVPSKPIETMSPDGFKVLIGRNNRQNDELTLRVAEKTDMWFHTKNIPGSHVIVKTGGKELPETTIIFAAEMAALHSNAAQSSAVPVDYTAVKYVKKPVGAKPGMVIYKTNKTVYVTPKGEK